MRKCACVEWLSVESTETAKALILQNFPQLHIETIELAGEGMDSRSFFVNDAYVFRFPKFPHVAESFRIEINLLPKLQKQVKITIPQFTFIGKESNGLLFVGYPKIEGVPLKSMWVGLTSDAQEKILQMLGTFLQQIHSFSLGEARKCGVKEKNSRRICKGDFKKVAKDIYPMLPKETRADVEGLYSEYLSEERNFTYMPTLLHADFGPGHIFCDEKGKRITGIIDFGDIGIGDPDYDFMYLYGEFGWEFILRFLQHYPRSDRELDVLRRKLRFLLIHNTIDDIWMGRDRKEEELEQWALGLLKKQVKEMRGGNFY